MKYYLYTFRDTLDGHKLVGFKVFTEIEKDIELTRIKKNFKNGGTIYFGEDGDYEYEYDSLRDLMSSIKIKEIHNIQYNSIKSSFESGEFGYLGPLNCQPEDEYCENCGGLLEECDQDMCDSCREDEEDEEWENCYNKQVVNLAKMIKTEFNLEETGRVNFASYFSWKPTSKTEIEISIKTFDDGGEDDEVEINLKYNNKDVGYECYGIEDAESDFEDTVKKTVNNFLNKSRSY